MAWEAVPGAKYRLTLGLVNSTVTAPVIIDTTATQQLVQGLTPGSYYDVTLTAVQFFGPQLCSYTERALTGKDTHTHTRARTHGHTQTHSVTRLGV